MTELQVLRKKQIKDVMNVIPDVLNVWDDLPNNVKSLPELKEFEKAIVKLDTAMEGG